MGMQDRDYYREWWKEKQGHVEKPSFRSPVSVGEDDGAAYLRSAARKESSWHPVLTLLATAAICGATYLVLLLIAHFLHIKR
ncbi:hypothetical protein Rfer_1415 [Rhodoferax ferrireducens T118]|uniref:Uncharacterized protein n=1 Tax=Albidiferax ferrireducens (strain ATCC BAA-621 / DSM 15236 / T118) TaxID=338969 RepID=Q21YK5_ALBFT|nr:hypothetical protein Rfer_1415 [Rhodoferax ferrireducens T118]